VFGTVVTVPPMPLPEGSLMRRKALSFVAFGLAALAAPSLAAAVGVLIPIRGTGTFCLTPAAAAGLAERHVALTALAPATLDTTGPTPCVTFPTAGGSVAPDISAGTVRADGGMSFTRSGDPARLDFTDLTSDITTDTFTSQMSVNGGAPAETGFLRYDIGPAYAGVTPSAITVTDAPATLAPAAADAFTATLGTAPTPADAPMFSIDGHAAFLDNLPGLHN
jgi:hypothetical protein